MALCRINLRKKPLLLPRPFSSSSSPNPPFPLPRHLPTETVTTPPVPPPLPRPPNPARGTTRRRHSSKTSASGSGPPPRRPRRTGSRPLRPSGHAPPTTSIDDIHRHHEFFRASHATRGAAPGASPDGGDPSFHDLLRSSSSPASPQVPNAWRKIPNFKSIVESLRNSSSARQPQQWRRPHSPTPFLSSSPHSIFGKELGEKTKKAKGVGKEEDSVIELKREHSYEELGKKLGQLRPSGAEKDGKEWFSLEELQGQNAKLSCHPRSCASSK